VVTTPEAPVTPEAAAAKAAVTPTPAAAKAAVATEATVAEATATEATVAEAAVAEAAVAEAVATATPGRRRDVHWADYSRYRRRGGGVSCGGSTEKHCAGHRACADCADGDAAGRRE
jgi:hypothetical protein